MQMNKRTNANGVDLNRNFPTKTGEKMKEKMLPVMTQTQTTTGERVQEAKLKHSFL